MRCALRNGCKMKMANTLDEVSRSAERPADTNNQDASLQFSCPRGAVPLSPLRGKMTAFSTTPRVNSM